MNQWEYAIFVGSQHMTPTALGDQLTKHGADGWELAAILGLMFIFKREKRSVIT